ncbi:chitinase [Streptomyces sp. NBC_00847]|uniref:chitinase n=1 Tax=Streptomyces sp. NBC_00847 TaxID=2975850 RepID=UPI002254A810|nr:chitinase [Streptomyces sp. NBC_00847]MCX4882228.1 chitinase [Streptomyces sp. NBC_00847]
MLSNVAVTGLAAGLVALSGGGALAAGAGPSPYRPGTMPARVSAPYFEAWTGQSPAAPAAASGNKYLTMAFLQTDAPGSCTAYWNGATNQPISRSSFGEDISAIQARGGNVIPSFGGYSADTTGTELADSCTSVDAIAKVYESLVTTYGITRIDLDVEADSINNAAGIDRRNKAIAKAQRWAGHTGRHVQFSYTLPTTTTGLAPNGVALLQNAVGNGARVDVVNIMTFDYWDGAVHDMAADTETAAAGLHGQLGVLHPKKSPAKLWHMIGVTEMPGIDDFGPEETFTTQDAVKVEKWAVAKGINTLSFWALQRDNGGCVGTKGSDSCSGIAQDTWHFSHTFAPFTRRWRGDQRHGPAHHPEVGR